MFAGLLELDRNCWGVVEVSGLLLRFLGCC